MAFDVSDFLLYVTHQHKWSKYVNMFVAHHVNKHTLSGQLQNTTASLHRQLNYCLLTMTVNSTNQQLLISIKHEHRSVLIFPLNNLTKNRTVQV